MGAARRQLSGRAAALTAALLFAGGCSLTFQNDDHDWGGQKNKDRWYTAGLRAERPVVVEDDGSLPTLLDELVLDFAELLPTAGDDEPGSFSTAASVVGLQMYTPENTRAKGPVRNDRPYAGYVYTGIVRRDTWLDPDPTSRRDTLATVELDLGMVGPGTGVGDLQGSVHGFFGVDEANGWSNQLDNEVGLELRAERRWRTHYDEFSPASGWAYDVTPRADGALGNFDTHVGVGGTARLGVNLSRSLDPTVGDPSQLLPSGRRAEPPSSLYLFADVDGRFVIHNLFLEGNTFEDSLSVDPERLVGEGAIGVGWEYGQWRVAYSKRVRTIEFEGQPDDEIYGSLTVSWTPVP